MSAAHPSFFVESVGSVVSTMDVARARLTAAPRDVAGLVIVATRQTGGRGRLGRHWESPPGNLYATLVLQEDVPPGKAAQLGFLASLAIAEAGESLGAAPLSCKWPNDVLAAASRAKLAGILLETSSPQGSGMILLGFGVNLAHAPPSLGAAATTLYAEGVAASTTPAALLEAILERFAQRRDAWRAAGFAATHRDWSARAALLGERVSVRSGGRSLVGRFRGIDEHGRLELETEDGTPPPTTTTTATDNSDDDDGLLRLVSAEITGLATEVPAP